MRTTAGVLSIVLGLGFGLPCIGGIRHLARTGEVWTFLGFPTYSGPFERIGLITTVPLLVAFLVVCLLEVVVGALLIGGHQHASLMSHLLLPFELVFWAGFALPFGPIVGVPRTVLLIVA